MEPTLDKENNKCGYFTNVEDAVSSVTTHSHEWQCLEIFEKAQLVGECLENLRRCREEYALAGLLRRGYLFPSEDSTDSTKINLDAYETEKALIQITTGLHLAVWLSNIKQSMEYVAKNGHFPRPSTIERNSNGTIKVQLQTLDSLNWIISGTATFELHVQNPELYNTMSSNSPEVKQFMNNNNAVHNDISTFKPCSNKEQNDIDVKMPVCEKTVISHSNGLQLNNLNISSNDNKPYGVSAVLGAGNYDAPVDFLTALLIENNVVVYKFSPLSISLIIPLQKIFEPFLSRGYLAFVQGGPKEGEMLLHHKQVHKWFMTGNIRTANMILFGVEESPFSNREPNSVKSEEIETQLLIKKPFTIELGSVCPYIICPGIWTDLELYRHARHLVFGLLLNGGHICAHPQLILTCRKWSQRDTFLNYVCKVMKEANTVGKFYSTSEAHCKKLKTVLLNESNNIEDSHYFEPNGNSNILFVTGLSSNSHILKEEAFCQVAGEIPFDTDPTIKQFLTEAVQFVNKQANGTLCATIIAKTETVNEQEIVNQAIIDLKYGSVGLNVFGLNTIYFPQLIWGGYPENINASHMESGIGFFGNCHGYRHPLKAVIRCPFMGPNQLLQVIPVGQEICRMHKLLDRLIILICTRAQNKSYIGQLVTGIKLLSGVILGF